MLGILFEELKKKYEYIYYDEEEQLIGINIYDKQYFVMYDKIEDEFYINLDIGSSKNDLNEDDIGECINVMDKLESEILYITGVGVA